MEPCRGSDSGSNPDSGAPFLPVIDERGPSALGTKCKLECKLVHQPNRSGLSDLVLLFTHEDLSGYLTLRAGLTSKAVTWLKKSAELLWNATRGVINVSTMSLLRHNILSNTMTFTRNAKPWDLVVLFRATCLKASLTSGMPPLTCSWSCLFAKRAQNLGEKRKRSTSHK